MKIFFSILFFLTFYLVSNSQDAQFSQFYAAPLYMNPAFTGTVENTRTSINYRCQWPTAGNQAYTTVAAAIDHYAYKYRSGIGFMLVQNTAGTAKLRSTEASLLYSFQVEINDRWKFIPALQATLVNRDLNFYSLSFPDQFTSSGYTGAPTNEPLNYTSKIYGDFSTGGLLYSEKFWFGASYHHLNHPNQSLSSNIDRLPGQFNFQLGAKIPIDNSLKGRSTQNTYNSKALFPSIFYKAQGDFDQLDLGMYMLIEPLVFGLYYRGIPVKHYKKGFKNVESVIFMVGYNYKQFSFGYSYDLVVSKLSMASGGAHELSLVFLFGKDQVPQKSRRRLPCPSFYNKVPYF